MEIEEDPPDPSSRRRPVESLPQDVAALNDEIQRLQAILAEKQKRERNPPNH